MKIFLILLLTVPLVELWLLVEINDAIGLSWTVALVIITAILGSIHVRGQGLKTLARIRTETQAGRMPGEVLTEGLLILAAGLLLMTPGVLTDLVGFFFLFPPSRRALASPVKAWILARFVGSISFGMPGFSASSFGPSSFGPPSFGPPSSGQPSSGQPGSDPSKPPQSGSDLIPPRARAADNPIPGEIIVDAKTVEYTDEDA